MYNNQCIQNNVYKTIYTKHVYNTCIQNMYTKPVYNTMYIKQCVQKQCIHYDVYKTMDTKQCIKNNVY